MEITDKDQNVTAKNVPKNLLKGLKRPNAVEFYHVDKRQDYGKFVAEPFEKGFGTTIGNSLRRVLMSYIEGTAIVAVKIEGADHEFSVIPGVTEDVPRIILNLKKIRFQYEENGPLTLEIRKKGAGFLLASDLNIDSRIKVVNPDIIIAHMNEKADIHMTLQINKGRGYLPSEVTKKMIDDVGVIPIDALFSPVKKVNFEISEIRVGQRTDYDKLILEVWTDETSTPEDVVAYAAKILKEHLSVFINFEEELYEEEGADEINEELKAILNTSLEALEFSIRTFAVLKSLDMKTVQSLVTSRCEEDLRKSKHYSDKVLLQIKSKVAELGLSFEMRELSE